MQTNGIQSIQRGEHIADTNRYAMDDDRTTYYLYYYYHYYYYYYYYYYFI